MADAEINLLTKLRKGDTNSFRELVELYKNKAFSLAIRILKNETESEDCVQESFMKFYKALMDNQFTGKSKLSTYFYSIVYNTAVEFYRKIHKKSFSIVSIDINENVYNEGDELLKNLPGYRTESASVKFVKHGNETDYKLSLMEINGIIYKYINSIPEHYSVVLNMFYINELSCSEISGILNIPEGTVKNRIFRAREKLKQLILKNYPLNEILNYV